MIDLIVPMLILGILLYIGTPVGFAMAAAGVVGIASLTNLDVALALLATGPHTSTQSFSLTAVPMFILMAEFLGASTLVAKLFDTARAWFGRVPGGLAVASIGAGAGMGALSGSSVAATASLAGTTVPEMRKSGYSERLALGSVASAGTLATLIPPSVPLLIYGITTETSIIDVFTAGIIPGIILAVLFAAVVVVWQRMRPEIAPPSPRTPWAERVSSLVHTLPAILLVVLVLGGMYSGIVTSSEAGAIGAIGALIVGMAFGGLRGPGMIAALRRTAELTAAIFIIVIGAKIFSQFMTLTGVTQSLAKYVSEGGFPPLLVLIVILLVYAVLGCFMDGLGMMLLTLPVFFPLVMELGYDPVWFGVIIAVVIELGLITPPVGLNVYVTVGSGKGDLGAAFRGVTRFYVAVVFLVVLLIAFPEIATWLPSLRES
jgi:tripartite ATP-independent transporter DctM subunit